MIQPGTMLLHSIEALVTKRLMKARGDRGSGKSTSRRSGRKSSATVG